MSNQNRRADAQDLKEALTVLIACAATMEASRYIVLSSTISEQESWVNISQTLSTVDVMKLMRKVNPDENKIAWHLLWTELAIKDGKLADADWKELDDIIDRFQGSHRQALVNAYLRVIWEQGSTYVKMPDWLIQKCIDEPLVGCISSIMDDNQELTSSRKIVEKYVKSSIKFDAFEGYSDEMKQYIVDNGNAADLRALIQSLNSSDIKWFKKLAEYHYNWCEGRPGGHIAIQIHEYAASRRRSLGISAKDMKNI